ncbi:MAG: SDR family NAD(P)-dependent oxidoreductase [Spirosomataceae bacterium]
MNDFSGQAALITGAASGIGLAIARTLLAEGVKAALLDFNEEGLHREFESYGDQVLLIGIDVTDEAQVQAVVEQAVAHFGRVDILVNCVGITGVTNLKSHEVSSENMHKVFEVNFMSCFYTSKAVLPSMMAQNYGRILHIASIAGKEGNAGMLAYSASKAAVIGLTKVQGKEYAEYGITVNALAPAVIQTPLVDAMPEVQVKYMTDKIPMKRCGTLEEAANLAAYIVSSKNSFTTGFTFDLSGGRATY